MECNRVTIARRTSSVPSPPPTLGERRHRVLTRRLVAVGCVVYTTIAVVRPHPSAVLRPNRHLEDTADELAIREHVIVVVVPADRRAFEYQLRCLLGFNH